MDPYRINEAENGQVPLVVSVPHCGIKFPDDIRDEIFPDYLNDPDDTDWFVDQLYDFVPSMGIPIISALYSRWVIDLNRDPSSKPLYTDGRMITGLCPVTTFQGEPLYTDKRESVADEEVQRRLGLYYEPYHHALQKLLNQTIARFGKVLLWDCHSIRQHVPMINKDKFPDLILGDNDGLTAAPFITELVSKSLVGGGYSFENNYLFKGGYITRHYGQPGKHQHALQLEMTKVNYMDDAQKKYDNVRAQKMKEHLKRTFEKLITALSV